MISALADVNSNKPLYFPLIEINVCYRSRMISALADMNSNKLLYFPLIEINVCYISRSIGEVSSVQEGVCKGKSAEKSKRRHLRFWQTQTHER
jgi:hypothetical protein